jgi:hypothetical protein
VEEIQHPWGRGDTRTEIRIEYDEDELLNLDAILSKWEAKSIGRGLAPSTKAQYRCMLRRFAEYVGLETRERKWFVSKAAHESIIAWTMSLPPKSRRIGIAALESAWTFGIDSPFPVSTDRDFGRRVMPLGDQRPCPKDPDIEPLYKAAEHEDDPYLQSFVFVALSTGLRPGNQLMQLTWADIPEHDGNLAIVAQSTEARRFKTPSPVIARLPDIASDALKAWRKQTPYGAPSDYVWPLRQFGKLTNRKGGRQAAEREYFSFLKRHGLKTWVRLAHVRHWIELAGERDGIPATLLAYIRGHAVKGATEGRLGYSGNRRVEAVLDDLAARWPNGPCGVFGAPVVVEASIPPDVSRLLADFMSGRVDATVFALRMADLRARSVMLKP